MNRIRVLPDQVANQIAAGEVVERPASVAKELVENSLDAGARIIRIDVEAGGRRLLRVTDDGSGMTRDDAVLAFERHATSKITADSDLNAIQTLGFRGEALPSIGSVARVEMVTKTAEDDRATRLTVEGGRMQEVKDAAHPNGTTITMRDLFYNVPARRKFLRSEATESYHLTNLVTNYSLAQPAVSFTLQHNGREILRAATATDLRERVYQLFGASFVSNLLEVNNDMSPVARIHGYISLPRERRNSRDAQYLFVNGRSVRDRVLTRAVTEAYRPLLAQGAYPVAILFVEVPWSDVDVNVHPAKTEVRFRRSAAVAEAVRDALQSTLIAAGYLKPDAGRPEVELPETKPTGVDHFAVKPGENTRSGDVAIAEEISVTGNDRKPDTVLAYGPDSAAKTVTAPNGSILPKAQSPTAKLPFAPVHSSSEQGTRRAHEVTDRQIADGSTLATVNTSPTGPPISLPPLDSLAGLMKAAPSTSLSSGIRPLGQVDRSFIVATDDQGLLMIDQHVAHERILFDRFQSRTGTREAQALLVPETIDLSPAQAAVFDSAQPELEASGFDLMRLSGRTIAVKAVPVELPVAELRTVLLEIIDSISGDQRNRRSTLKEQITSRLACRAAIPSNTTLSFEKMTWLVENLVTASVPTVSPHGRPVVLRLALRDLEKAFRR